jgi:UDP-glucuronate 4-epimerase
MVPGAVQIWRCFSFTKNIIEGKPITLFNNGDMFRDFTYVDDIVNGIVAVMGNMSKFDMYSLGYGEKIPLMRFVEAIEAATKIKADIKYGPRHPADALGTLSDTTKIRKLGWKPTTQVEVGVDRFVKMVQNLL